MHYTFETVSLMASSLYNSSDHHQPEVSHVPSALTRKFLDAAQPNADRDIGFSTGTTPCNVVTLNDLDEARTFPLEHWPTVPDV